jgi:hypothetical protein
MCKSRWRSRSTISNPFTQVKKSFCTFIFIVSSNKCLNGSYTRHIQVKVCYEDYIFDWIWISTAHIVSTSCEAVCARDHVHHHRYFAISWSKISNVCSNKCPLTQIFLNGHLPNLHWKWKLWNILAHTAILMAYIKGWALEIAPLHEYRRVRARFLICEKCWSGSFIWAKMWVREPWDTTSSVRRSIERTSIKVIRLSWKRWRRKRSEIS